jgi:hypothetical protein
MALIFLTVFPLKNCGITILKILRYTVFAILDSKTAVIDKICLQYYSVEYSPNAPLQFMYVYSRPHDFITSLFTLLLVTNTLTFVCYIYDILPVKVD